VKLKLSSDPRMFDAIAAAIAREANRREEVAKIAAEAASGERFSMVALAGSHALQYAAMVALARRIHIMCARQAGKTWADVGMLIDNALTKAGTTNIFLGLNSVAVRMNVWEPVLVRIFERFHDLDTRWLSKGQMIVRFPNGSRIIFGGYDDIRHVRNFLGGRLAGAVIILDEAQDGGQPLEELLDVILPPMLTPTSRVVLSGTIPDAPAGRFWDEGQRDSWQKFNWGRLANVHTPEAREMLDLYLKDTGLPESDPQIQRDWFGRPVFSDTATTYRYLAERNGYSPEAPDWLAEAYAAQADTVLGHALLFAHPMQQAKADGAKFGLMAAKPRPGHDVFGFAIDPGATSDRASIQGIAWGAGSRKIQHVFDWTTPRAARLTTGQIFAVAGLAHRVFGKVGSVLSWRYDASGSQNTIDNLMNDYRLPMILAAKKTDTTGQIMRCNDLLTQSRADIMLGSALEQDYKRARLDPVALANGQHKWLSAWHPDPSEAFRYSTADYFDSFSPPKDATVFDDKLLKSIIAAAEDDGDRPRYS
jgi:hypothetical protein